MNNEIEPSNFVAIINDFTTGLTKFDDAFVDATSEPLSDLSRRTCVVNEFAGGGVILRSSSAKSGRHVG